MDENARLFSQAIEERDEKIKSLSGHMERWKTKCGATEEKYRCVLRTLYSVYCTPYTVFTDSVQNYLFPAGSIHIYVFKQILDFFQIKYSTR